MVPVDKAIMNLLGMLIPALEKWYLVTKLSKK
jgi:hypothetical protein